MVNQQSNPRPLLRWIGLGLILWTSSVVQAGSFCTDFPGSVIDGNDPLTLSMLELSTQVTIDSDCRLRNFPASNPLTATFNFQTMEPPVFLMIFDNVEFVGNIACSNIPHKIWASNTFGFGALCQSLMVPVEAMHMETGQSTATIGEPFSYTLTFPVLNGLDGSTNDLHSVVLWNDLTASGVDLSLVSIEAHYLNSGIPVVLVPETNSATRGGVWTNTNLSYEPIALISAGEQIVVNITVSLDDTPNNSDGTTFINTAKWYFGRIVEKDVPVLYDDLPGEWAVSTPMTVSVSSTPPPANGGGPLSPWALITGLTLLGFSRKQKN